MTETAPADRLQQRVAEMVYDCCEGGGDPTDIQERADRFIEEAMEFYQAVPNNSDAWNRARRILAYVMTREVGEPQQEAGGTQVTLMALCERLGINALVAGHVENERCRDPAVVASIRVKRAGRVPGDPLPGGRILPNGDGWVPVPDDLTDWPEFLMVWGPQLTDSCMVMRKSTFIAARAPGVPAHLSMGHLTHIRPQPDLPLVAAAVEEPVDLAPPAAPQRPGPRVRRFRMRADSRLEPRAVTGSIVYDFLGCDYGLASDDNRAFGYEHRSVTLNPDGTSPSFTVPVSALEEVES